MLSRKANVAPEPRQIENNAHHRVEPVVVRDANNAGSSIDVDLLLFFHAVAETLSYTKAAERLGIDQSWLSHKIRQFEAALGFNLFIRSTRSVELTRAGQALRDPARQLAQATERARAAASMLQRSIAGAVRIGALPFSFSDGYRTALLDKFMKIHLDIQLAVSNGPSPALLDHLCDGQLDLAFVSAPFDEGRFDKLLLRVDGYCIVLPRKHPLAALPKITADTLRKVRVVLPSESFSPAAYAVYYQPLVEAGIIPVPVPEFQCAITYAGEWDLPVVCTKSAADNWDISGYVSRALDFIPPCEKYLVRLSTHRTPAQMLLWDMAAEMTQTSTVPPNLERVTRADA
jgi:DNA-binding transcriptional LysR family regulator